MEEKNDDIYVKKLKRLRANEFLTQREMAIKMKISQQGYSKLENGVHKFTVKRIDKICKIFKISFDEFIANNTKPKKVNRSATESRNIRFLKLHYEKLLLEKDMRIGELEIQVKHLSKNQKSSRRSPKLYVLV